MGIFSSILLQLTSVSVYVQWMLIYPTGPSPPAQHQLWKQAKGTPAVPELHEAISLPFPSFPAHDSTWIDGSSPDKSSKAKTKRDRDLSSLSNFSLGIQPCLQTAAMNNPAITSLSKQERTVEAIHASTKPLNTTWLHELVFKRVFNVFTLYWKCFKNPLKALGPAEEIFISLQLRE